MMALIMPKAFSFQIMYYWIFRNIFRIVQSLTSDLKLGIYRQNNILNNLSQVSNASQNIQNFRYSQSFSTLGVGTYTVTQL